MKLLSFVLLFLVSCTTGLFAFPQIPEENGTIQAFFCDKVNCTTILANVSAGKTLSCAMYHLSPDFLKLNITMLVVDSEHPVDGAIVETGSSLIHDKF